MQNGYLSFWSANHTYIVGTKKETTLVSHFAMSTVNTNLCGVEERRRLHLMLVLAIHTWIDII